MVDTTARLTTLTRLGFAARGMLYSIVAVLVLTAGRTEDLAGALRYLGQGGGRILLIIMTLGLVGYGIWRLSDAAFNIGRHGNDGSGIRERLASALSGSAHLFLAWQAVRLIRGASAASGNTADDYASSALSAPGGATALVVCGVLTIAVGALQLVKAAKCSFLDNLDPRAAHQAWAKWTGRFGYAARGVVFGIIGLFLARAGWASEASEAGGMAEALAWLEDPWDMIVAAGLLAFGLFSFIEARYRVLNDGRSGSIGERIRSSFT